MGSRSPTPAALAAGFPPGILLAHFLSWFLVLVRCYGADMEWPGIEYSHVKGYLFRGDPSADSRILIDGNINPSVEKVVRLTAEQGRKISTAMQDPPKERRNAMCFDPHHAFVYFDSESKPVAWVNFCYHCNTYYTDPPLLEGKILNLSALTPICREIGLPVPGDKAFDDFVGEGQRLSLQRDALEEKLGEALVTAQDRAPSTEAMWPWRPYATVKLFAFNDDGRNDWIVHFGRLNPSVTKEVTLTADQCAAIWSAFRSPREWEPLNEKQEVKQGYMDSKFRIREKGGKWSDEVPWTPGRELIRHALVCFDADGKPVAWLRLSFNDFTYIAYPRDGGIRSDPWRWNPRRLAELFPKMGIPILSAEEHERRRRESK